jgi:uncharacterized protein
VDAVVMSWILPVTAFTTGLLGSVHCLGMCCGVSATVALASKPPRSASGYSYPGAAITTAAIPFSARFATEVNVLAFNIGRITSYALAGALAGTVGAVMGGLGQSGVISQTMGMRTALFVLANLMIVLTGLYLMGVAQLLAPLERAGSQLWRHLSPLTRKLLPLRSPGHAALFGMLWGWIPCGMVYAMLLTAMSSGSALMGMLTMAAFGAGTLPMMLASGWAAGSLRRWTRHPRVRLAAGLTVVALGVFGLARVSALEQLQTFGAYCAALLQPNAPRAQAQPWTP